VGSWSVIQTQQLFKYCIVKTPITFRFLEQPVTHVGCCGVECLGSSGGKDGTVRSMRPLKIAPFSLRRRKWDAQSQTGTVRPNLCYVSIQHYKHACMETLFCNRDLYMRLTNQCASVRHITSQCPAFNNLQVIPANTFPKTLQSTWCGQQELQTDHYMFDVPFLCFISDYVTLRMYVCMYVCVCIYICIYIYIYTPHITSIWL
jgi:hypothetical protein